jgi:hypothetical protein
MVGRFSMRSGIAWWGLVPVLAVSVTAREVRGQTCAGAVEVSATVVDMEEAGGVGAGVQHLTERALEPIRHPGTPAVRDTTVKVQRATITTRTLPPPDDRLQITVVYPD